MFNLIILILLYIGAYIISLINIPIDAMIIFYIITSLYTFGTIVANFNLFSEQQYRFEEFRKLKRMKTYEEEYSSKLIEELKIYILEKFPEMQKDILDKYKDYNILLAMSETGSLESIKELTSVIKKKEDEKKKITENIESNLRDIRYADASYFLIFKPEIPKDIKIYLL